MTSILSRALLVASIVLLGSVADAALVQWQIDPAASFVRLNVPDQQSWIDVQQVLLRIRNQNNAAWTTNVAQLSGQLNSNYQDGASIQFLTNPIGQVVGLASGDYRPNPAAFNATNTDAANPNGQYDDTSSAPGVMGFRANATMTPFNFDLARGNFVDMLFDLASAPLAIDGSGEFAAVANFGMAGGTVAIDGLSSALGQIIPDALQAADPMMGINAATLASIVAPDPINQPLLRQLQITINTPVDFTFPGLTGGVPATFTGTIVAYATIPEPATGVLGIFAVGAVGWLAWRRRNKS